MASSRIETRRVPTGMKHRWLLPAALAIALLAACQPDPVAPGAGTDPAVNIYDPAPTETESTTRDPYDY